MEREKLEAAVQAVVNEYNFGNSSHQLPKGYFKIAEKNGKLEANLKPIFPTEAAAQKAVNVWLPYFQKHSGGIVVRAFTHSSSISQSTWPTKI